MLALTKLLVFCGALFLKVVEVGCRLYSICKRVVVERRFKSGPSFSTRVYRSVKIFTLSVQDTIFATKKESLFWENMPAPDVKIIGLIKEVYGLLPSVRDLWEEIVDYAIDLEERYAWDTSEIYDPRPNVYGIIYALKELRGFAQEIVIMAVKFHTTLVRERIEMWREKWRDFLTYPDYRGIFMTWLLFVEYVFTFVARNPQYVLWNLFYYWPRFLYVVVVRSMYDIPFAIRALELELFIKIFPTAEQKLGQLIRFAFCFYLFRHYRLKELFDPLVFPTDELEIRQRLRQDQILSKTPVDIWIALFGSPLASAVRYMVEKIQENTLSNKQQPAQGSNYEGKSA